MEQVETGHASHTRLSALLSHLMRKCQKTKSRLVHLSVMSRPVMTSQHDLCSVSAHLTHLHYLWDVLLRHFQVSDILPYGRLLESGPTVGLLHGEDGRCAGCLGRPAQAERPRSESEGP